MRVKTANSSLPSPTNKTFTSVFFLIHCAIKNCPVVALTVVISYVSIIFGIVDKVDNHSSIGITKSF